MRDYICIMNTKLDIYNDFGKVLIKAGEIVKTNHVGSIITRVKHDDTIAVMKTQHFRKYFRVA